MQIDPALLQQIGITIRSVSVAHAMRFFRSEGNTLARAALVGNAILAEIGVALHDLGLSLDMINQIDPTEIILGALAEQGYPIQPGDVVYKMSVTDNRESASLSRPTRPDDPRLSYLRTSIAEISFN